MYKVEINVLYKMGAMIGPIWFKKTFELGFAPYYNLIIDDSQGDLENIIRLENWQSTFQGGGNINTDIFYNTNDNSFEITKTEMWGSPVREDVIDDILNTFTETGWERYDSNDAEEMKKQMKEIYERRTR